MKKQLYFSLLFSFSFSLLSLFSQVLAEVQLESVQGTFEGVSVIVTKDGTLKLLSVSGETKEFSIRDVIGLSWSRSSFSPSGLTRFQFRNGDLIYGDIVYEQVKEQNDMLKIGSSKLSEKPFNLYLTDLQAIRFQENIELPAPQKEDQIILKSGDRTKGLIKFITNTGFQFTSNLGTAIQPFSDIKAVVLNQKTPKKESRELFANITTIEGSQLTVKIQNIENSIIQATTFWAVPTTIRIPLERVKHIRFKNGNFRYLSDLEPIDTLYVPFFDLVFPYKRDLNQRGGPLKLGEKIYSKGLGVHAKTSLIYELEASYSKFRAIIGIDSSIGSAGKSHGGKVHFRVFVDGEMVAEHLLTQNSAPVSLDVNIKDAEELELVVDFGAAVPEQIFYEDHVNDVANWCNAILVE